MVCSCSEISNHGLFPWLFKFFWWKYFLNQMKKSGLKSTLLCCLRFLFFLDVQARFLSAFKMYVLSIFFLMFIVLWMYHFVNRVNTGSALAVMAMVRVNSIAWPVWPLTKLDSILLPTDITTEFKYLTQLDTLSDPLAAKALSTESLATHGESLPTPWGSSMSVTRKIIEFK